MPLLLSVIFGCATVACAVSAWATVLGLFGLGRFTINGQEADPIVFLRAYGWVLLLPGLLAAPIAYAIRYERPWSRDAVILWWVAFGALFVVFNLAVNSPSSVLKPLVNAAVGLGFSWWYLYRKPTVVAYYEALEARDREITQLTSSAGG